SGPSAPRPRCRGSFRRRMPWSALLQPSALFTVLTVVLEHPLCTAAVSRELGLGGQDPAVATPAWPCRSVAVPSTVSSRSTPFSSRSSKPSSPSSKSSPESLAISTLSRSLSQPASSARSSELVVGDDVPHGCIPVPADDQLVEERAGHTADLVRPVGLGPVGAPIHREGGVAGARAV